MRHGREYWIRHVTRWRQSGLTMKAYSERHELSYWSLRNWAAKLSEPAAGQPLVELAPFAADTDAGQRAAIELVVGKRYLLRLWPSVRAAHLREVLAALEAPK